MTLYTTPQKLAEYSADLPADTNRMIAMAMRHVDILTFGRIGAIGYDRLTGFQKDMLSEATARLAVFEFEHADELASMVSSYSINGVSVSFGETAMVKVMNGVVVPVDIYETLKLTGLTCRVI